MKKIIIAALFCTFAMGNVRVMAQAKIIAKQDEKAIKARVKEILKGGWHAFEQDNLTMHVAEHAVLMRNNQYMSEITGQGWTSDLQQGLDMGKTRAKTDAARTLAHISSTCYIGLLCDTTELRKTYAERYDTLIVNWKANLTDKIPGILWHPFYVYRAEKNTSPTSYTVYAYFLYNERVFFSLIQQQLAEACKETGIEIQHNGLDLIELYDMQNNR